MKCFGPWHDAPCDFTPDAHLVLRRSIKLTWCAPKSTTKKNLQDMNNRHEAVGSTGPWIKCQRYNHIKDNPIEIPYLRLRSHQELWSRSWHGWFLEQSFLVRNLFYNAIFVDVLFRGWDGQRKGSRFLSNTSTFLPKCLQCVLPIMRCAFGAHLDVGFAERQTPCRFIETVPRFLPSFSFSPCME